MFHLREKRNTKRVFSFFFFFFISSKSLIINLFIVIVVVVKIKKWGEKVKHDNEFFLKMLSLLLLEWLTNMIHNTLLYFIIISMLECVVVFLLFAPLPVFLPLSLACLLACFGRKHNDYRPSLPSVLLNPFIICIHLFLLSTFGIQWTFTLF